MVQGLDRRAQGLSTALPGDMLAVVFSIRLPLLLSRSEDLVAGVSHHGAEGGDQESGFGEGLYL